MVPAIGCEMEGSHEAEGEAKRHLWKLAPEEMRLWKGEGGPDISRRCGFFMAVAVASATAVLGIHAMLTSDAEWACWRLVSAAAILALGRMVRRDSKQAALALLVLFP